MQPQRIAVVGAGAIGGWLAAALDKGGASVSLLARGQTLQALRQHGLRVRHAQEEFIHRLPASSDARELGVQDVVFLAVKAPALPAVLPSLRALMGPGTTLGTAMNGVPWWFLHGLSLPFAARPLSSVDPGGNVGQAVPMASVVGGVVHASCSLDAPATVRRHFGNQLILGEPDGSDSARLRGLVELLARGGIEAKASARIQRDIWFKLWGNMTMNPISALTGATTDRVLGDPDVRALVSAVMLEARAVGEKIGLPIDQEPEDRHAVTAKLGAFKTSMLQDVEAGRPVELDTLLGAVIELGQLTTTAMPFSRALMGLARVHAQTRGLY